MDLSAWKKALSATTNALDPLSKLAQIIAVAIAGFWSYHIHRITGEADIDPELGVSTQVIAYSQGARLLVVHLREKNVGKVPLDLRPDALTLTVKKVPDSLTPGYVKMGSQPTLFEEKHLWRDDAPYISPGTEQKDVAAFVVAPGTYTVNASVSLPDGDIVSQVAFQKVD